MLFFRIEGNPFITRFKTSILPKWVATLGSFSIEGNPFITRLKKIAIEN